MVVDADGRTCECGCGEKLPPYRGRGRRQRFVDDAHRQRAYRINSATGHAIDVWDNLQNLGERLALATLAGLEPSVLASLSAAVEESLAAKRDGFRS